jgi:putative ABC transport system permease protein
LVADTRSLPGVTSATVGSDTPLDGAWNHTFTAEGHEAEQSAGLPMAWHTLVDTNYFESLRIPLIHGRLFSSAEIHTPSQVVIISEGMAKHYWPNEDPVGRRLKWGGAVNHNPWYTIVGVVGDIKQGPLDAATKPHTFEPFVQACSGERLCSGRFLFVRSQRRPHELASEIRRVVQHLDPEQPIGPVVSMDEVVSTSLAPRRFNTFLLGLFAASALLLAAIGTYGVLAYNVTRRRRELGIRMALGARSAEILQLVLAKGLRLAFLGLAIGLVASLVLTRVIKTLLYEVSATDPLTFAAVTLVFLGVALLACWIPGRRATRVNPVTALHFE